MPVLVADSHPSSYRASSGFGAGTTGEVRTTAPCTAGTSHRGVTRFSVALTGSTPQAETNTVSRTHGPQAHTTVRRVSGSAGASAPGAGSSGNRQATAGC